MRLRLIVAGILLGAPFWAADTSLLQLAPPGTKFVMGARLSGLAPLLEKAMADAKSAGPQWDMMFAMLGFDPMRDLDEVMIAVTGTGQNPPALFAARGRFAPLRQRMAGQKGKIELQFVDDSLLLGGDATLVRAALRTHGNAFPLRGLAAKAADFAGRYDIYGVGVIGAPAPGTPEMVKQLERVQFGISARDGLEVTGEVTAKTPEAAQAMAMLLQAGLAGQKGAEDIAKRLDVAVEGSTLRASLALPQAELERSMREGTKMAVRAASAQPAASARGTAVKVTGAEPEEPSRVPAGAALVITGSESDGGTIVVRRP